MNRPKIFFSYSRFDSSFALKLAKDLRDSGSDVWIDQLDIQAGKHWDAAVEKALDSSSCVIVILTPTSIVSENVMDEVSFALESGKRIIPVMLVECPTPFRLRRLQRVDFTVDYEAGFSQLKKSIYPVETAIAMSGDSSAGATVNETDPLNSIVDPAADTLLWEQASEVNTISSYKKYLVESVTGSYVAEAQLMIKQLELEQKEDEMEIHLWQKAKSKNTLALFQNYLQAYPNGNFKPLALAAISDIEEKSGKPGRNNILSPATKQRIRAFKKVAVLGVSILIFCFVIMSFIKMNTGNEELKAWNEALLKNDSLAYALFCQKFPNGEYTLQAKRKSDSLIMAHQVMQDTTLQIPAPLVPSRDSTTQLIEKPKTDSLLKGVAVTKPKTNNVKTPASFKPGQHYQGGIIIYVTSTGDHGLIASAKEETQLTWETAKRKSASYKAEGYSDWRLPTKAELNRMYNARKHFEKPMKGLYWSSSEENEETAWVQNFNNGHQANSSKQSHLQMRAVRTF